MTEHEIQVVERMEQYGGSFVKALAQCFRTADRFNFDKLVAVFADYAAQRGHELGLDDYVWKYLSKLQHTELRAAGYTILAIDDIQDTAIGDINLIVRQ